MSFFRVGNTGILFSPAGPKAVDFSAPVSPPPEGLTPVWTAEYVDPSGVLQKTTLNPDGSTVINIRQYANVTFDARDSRSTSTGCTTAGGAAQGMFFGMTNGEALGGVWGTSGLSRDKDSGPPIFSHVFTSGAASVTPRFYVADPDARENDFPCAVNITPLGSVTDISAGGAWPTWVSGQTYGLTTGDYTARGPIETPGLYGIRIIKIGGGSDPIVAGFSPETRGVSHGSNITNRSRDVALVNINYAKFAVGPVGASYCGSYGGNCRHFGTGEILPVEYYFGQSVQAGNQVDADNCRATRGTFIVNASGIDGSVAESLPNYAMLGGGRSMNLAGTTLARTTGNEGGNPMRVYMDSTVLRHFRVYSTTPTFGFVKGSLRTLVYTSTPDDAWPDDDRIGHYATARAAYLASGSNPNRIGLLGTGNSYFWMVDYLLGGPGTVTPLFALGIGPQNDDPPPTTPPWTTDNGYEGGFIGGIERGRASINGVGSSNMSGRDFSIRDNRQLDGQLWPYTVNSNPNRTPPSMLGPYHTAARPVHSAFA